MRCDEINSVIVWEVGHVESPILIMVRKLPELWLKVFL